MKRSSTPLSKIQIAMVRRQISTSFSGGPGAKFSETRYCKGMPLRDRIRGVLGFPVTPFRQDLSLDLDGLERNVDEMASYPFCALVAAGGTGELYSLTAEEVEQVVRVTVQAAAGRMPVVAGTGFSGPIGADIARRAERAG